MADDSTRHYIQDTSLRVEDNPEGNHPHVNQSLFPSVNKEINPFLSPVSFGKDFCQVQPKVPEYLGKI